ncbi:XkdQ/YqbQ family protein [Paenibacillus sp. y28]|uniref:XkdQ/YqbQ family protein n=1 Tax=Paenibacillus sp. y28 TaxID=3129110 RepID=UPI003015C277
MLEILSGNHSGDLWDISEIVAEISWKTGRIGKASSVEFTFIKGALYQDKDFAIEPGDIIRMTKDGKGLFYGYVFSIDSGREENVRVTAYDQVRYLMSNDFVQLKNVTATEVIRHIAGAFNLQTGELADTEHKIPTILEDGKKLLDIICKALDLTLISTGKMYVFYDDFGELTLRDMDTMAVYDISLGEGSLLFDYSSKRSIDSETYNYIKLMKDDKEAGGRVFHILKNSETIARWGILQKYEKVDEKLNTEQINARLEQLMSWHNREQRSMSLQAIGDPRVRAGCYVPVFIRELGIEQMYLVEECTHKFEGADHTMQLELKVIS